MLGIGESHKRMVDRELLLRFLALSVNWDSKMNLVRDYKGNMKAYLNAFMKKYQNDSSRLHNFKNLCKETIEVYINRFILTACTLNGRKVIAWIL